MIIGGRVLCGALVAVLIPAAGAMAQASHSSSPVRQSLDDAWWTGPMLTPSAATLPRGRFLIEPYVFDVITRGRYDGDGVRRRAEHAHSFGSLTYVLYGLADRLTVGLIPIAGYTRVSDGPSSAGIRFGDVTLHAHYGLTKFTAGRRVPATALVVEQTLPTGKHDRLGDRPGDGFGSGAYTTSIALYSQSYFWLPTGRILRMRANASYSRSSKAEIQDVSVYGTRTGFRGTAQPGDTVLLSAAWEYSVTRRWVLAFDALYRHDGNTHVNGVYESDPALAPDPSRIRLDSGSSTAIIVAPAVEYSWTPRIGVLVGVRLIPAGRNTPSSITPAVAINIVR